VEEKSIKDRNTTRIGFISKPNSVRAVNVQEGRIQEKSTKRLLKVTGFGLLL
jgi:hypothetical protein